MSDSGSVASGVTLSVCVLAYNDEEILARCLDALGFADEVVVVVDAKTSDGTEKIARDKAGVVSVHRYQGDVEQKRHAISLATHPWVLLLDSDEVVSPALAREVQSFLSRHGDDENIAGASVNRLTYHLGRWIRHGDFYPDWKLRLFRRGRGKVVGLNPHGRIEVDGNTTRLAGDLQHYSYRDLADQLARIQRFSSDGAEAMHADGRKFRLVDLCLRPPLRFLRSYVLKRGFLDGTAGLIIGVATAFHVFLKYAKLWELERRSD